MNPGDAGIYDRYVVQDVIKEMAANKSLNAGGGFSAGIDNSSASLEDLGSSNKRKKVDYKIVVLMEVDKLTRQAQAALRRTMEKYSSSCRLILCCNNQSKVIEPVRSRCLGIRVAAPSVDEVSTTWWSLVRWFVRFVFFFVFRFCVSKDLYKTLQRRFCALP
jgi:replication factor C subunit 3/5